MAQESSAFIMVKKADLPKTPKAFQKYVDEYFREVKFHGEIFLVAVTTYGDVRGCRAKGAAPSHNASLRQYTEGLPKGQNLNDWIHKQANDGDKGGLVLNFYASWDDGHVSCAIDD